LFIFLGRGQIFVAKQKYDAIGNRSNRVLSFEKNEELEVLNANPNVEWWEVGKTDISFYYSGHSNFFCCRLFP